MGRRRQKDLDLPPRLHRKGDAYYYVTSTEPRRWIKMGKDLAEAKLAWAKLEGEQPDNNDKAFSAVAKRYKKEIFPTKAPQTQKDNTKELENLLSAFGHMPIDAIKPQHIQEYMEIRGQAAKVRANREKALFSHIFNFARSRGYTEAINPCQGIKGFKEAGRDRYIEDDEFRAVWEKVHYTVQDAMDLAYLTGQRPADVLKLNRADIKDGALWITQNKTGKKLRIQIMGELATVINRILARTRQITSLALIQDDKGHRLTYCALRSRFDKARELAGVNFQFRDIRAKSATDTDDLAHAQKLLGHKNRDMTEHYTRNKIGEKVKPLK